MSVYLSDSLQQLITSQSSSKQTRNPNSVALSMCLARSLSSVCVSNLILMHGNQSLFFSPFINIGQCDFQSLRLAMVSSKSTSMFDACIWGTELTISLAKSVESEEGVFAEDVPFGGLTMSLAILEDIAPFILSAERALFAAAELAAIILAFCLVAVVIASSAIEDATAASSKMGKFSTSLNGFLSILSPIRGPRANGFCLIGRSPFRLCWVYLRMRSMEPGLWLS